jgi:pseudouridine-5'-phosphate glycosidase
MKNPGKLKLSKPVRRALEGRRAVVALESTVITHGLPQPINLTLAQEMEEVVREHGAVPATVAVIKGVVRIGLANQLQTLAGEGCAQDQHP